MGRRKHYHGKSDDGASSNARNPSRDQSADVTTKPCESKSKCNTGTEVTSEAAATAAANDSKKIKTEVPTEPLPQNERGERNLEDFTTDSASSKTKLSTTHIQNPATTENGRGDQEEEGGAPHQSELLDKTQATTTTVKAEIPEAESDDEEILEENKRLNYSTKGGVRKKRNSRRTWRGTGRGARLQGSRPGSAADGPSPAASTSPTPSADGHKKSTSPKYQQAAVVGANGHFMCPSCNMVVDSQSEFTKHIRQHNTIEASATTHTCSLCGKSLSSASSLDRHMLVHSGERPFKCRTCSMAFTTNGNMHRHMRTHHDGMSAAQSEMGSADGLLESDDEGAVPLRSSKTPLKRKRAQSRGPRRKPPNENRGEEENEELQEDEEEQPLEEEEEEGEQLEEEEEECGDGEAGAKTESLQNGYGAKDEDEPLKKTALVKTEEETRGTKGTKSPSRSPIPSAKKAKLDPVDTKAIDSDPNNNNPPGDDLFVPMEQKTGVDLSTLYAGDADGTLHCPVCVKTFLCRVGLQNHLESHPANELQCRDCGKDSPVFSSYRALLKHCRFCHRKTVSQIVTRGGGGGSLNGNQEYRFLDAEGVVDNGKDDAVPVGFHDLTFVDFSTSKFALIAKSACERNMRRPSSEYHVFQCSFCKRAFPSNGSLELHRAAAHPKREDVAEGREEADKMRVQPGVVIRAMSATCVHCHAVFESDVQLAHHRLRHQVAEQCTTPYSTSAEEGVIADRPKTRKRRGPAENGMNPAAADSAPQLNKENFLALFELQSKTKDISSGDETAREKIRLQKARLLAAEDEEVELRSGRVVKRMRSSRVRRGGEEGADFADIQSILAVTNTAAILPSMMRMSTKTTSPVSNAGSAVVSPPPPPQPETSRPASPRTADSVLTASPELPPGTDVVNSTPPSSLSPPANSNSSSSSSSMPNRKDGESSVIKEDEEVTNSSAAPSTSKGKFSCNQCQQLLPNLRALKAHNRIHLGSTSPFCCNVCSYKSADMSTLLRHLRTHSGERPYMCNICQYAFTTKANCERHVRTKHNRHEREDLQGSMVYIPDLDSGSGSSQAGTETDEAPQKERSKSMEEEEELDDEDDQDDVEMEVSREEPAPPPPLPPPPPPIPAIACFVCQHCNQQFSQIRLLKQHLRTEHADMYTLKPYRCCECGLRFSSDKNCLRHVTKHHPKVCSPESAVGVALMEQQQQPVLAPVADKVRPLSLTTQPLPPAAAAKSRGNEGGAQVRSALEAAALKVPPASITISLVPPVAPYPMPALDLSTSSPAAACSSHPFTGQQQQHVQACALAPGMDASSSGSSTDDSDDLSGPESLTFHRITDLPPQDQPLDLAVHPMDLSVKSTSRSSASTSRASGLVLASAGAMDLSASSSRHESPVPLSTSTPAAAYLPRRSTATQQQQQPQVPTPLHHRNRSMPPVPATAAVATKPLSYASPIGGAPSEHPAKPPAHKPSRINEVAARLPLAAHPPRVPPTPPRKEMTIVPTHVVMQNTENPTVDTPSVICAPRVQRQQQDKVEVNLNRSSTSSAFRSHMGVTSENGSHLAAVVSGILLKKQKQRRYRTERPFKCAYCAAGFTLRSNMERHIKQQHPEFWASKARGRKVSQSGNTTPIKASTTTLPSISSPITMGHQRMEASVIQLPPGTSLMHLTPSPSSSTSSTSELVSVSTHHRLHPSPIQQVLVPRLSPMKSDPTKVTISSEVKQAISQQIKQRKAYTPIPSPIKLPAPSGEALSNSLSLLSSSSNSASSSPSLLTLSPASLATVKVTETKFPPSVSAASSPNDGAEMNASSFTFSPRPKVIVPTPAPPPPPSVPSENPDVEDASADLASVSKLLDTANQQNIQEMFRKRATADDDDIDEEDEEGEDEEEEEGAAVGSEASDGELAPGTSNPMSSGQYKPSAAGSHNSKCGGGSKGNSATGVNVEDPLANVEYLRIEKSREGRRSAYVNAPNRVACPYCHRQFPWTSSLRRHILTHTGQKPYKCPQCPLWFTTKSNCDRHLSRKHGGTHSVVSAVAPASLGMAANGRAAVSGNPSPVPGLVVTPPIALNPASGICEPLQQTSSSSVASASSSPLAMDCTARNAPDRPYRCHFCLSSTFSTPGNLQRHLSIKHSVTATPLALQKHPAVQMGGHVSPLQGLTIPPLPPPLFPDRRSPGSRSERDDEPKSSEDVMADMRRRLDVTGSGSGQEEGAGGASNGESADDEHGSNWGGEFSSEESGEDGGCSAAEAPCTASSANPSFFCLVCLKSFSERHPCLEHLQKKHPDEHGLLLTTANNVEPGGNMSSLAPEDTENRRPKETSKGREAAMASGGTDSSSEEMQ